MEVVELRKQNDEVGSLLANGLIAGRRFRRNITLVVQCGEVFIVRRYDMLDEESR